MSTQKNSAIEKYRNNRSLIRRLAVASVVTAIGVGTAFGVAAQEHGERGHFAQKFKDMSPAERDAHITKRIDKRLQKLDAKLDLSDAQLGQIEGILREAANQKITLLSAEGEKGEKRGKMKALKQSTKAKIGKVLTPEQNAKFAKLKRDKRGKKGKHGKHGKKRIEKMAKKLDLTAEQRNQIEAIMEQTQREVKAAREASNGDEEVFRAKRKELRKAAKADIASVLTPEQRAQFEEMRAKHGKRGQKGKRGKRGER